MILDADVYHVHVLLQVSEVVCQPVLFLSALLDILVQQISFNTKTYLNTMVSDEGSSDALKTPKVNKMVAFDV